MRAVTIIDKVLAVSDMPDPVPGTGEVLVKVHAAGLNGADMMQRQGHYPAPPGAPQEIPGLELAGEVVQLGPGATRFAVGDRVMGIVGGGGQAELCTVHERILMPVPERLSWTEAGGTPEVFTTAHDAVFTQGQLVAGERLLVHGGAGGVGELNLGLLMHKRARIYGSTLRARPLEQKAMTARAVERSVLPALASGRITVPIAETFALADAVAAYDRFAAGGKLGKIVLVAD